MGNACTSSSKKNTKDTTEITVSSNNVNREVIEIDVVPGDLIPKDLIQRTLKKAESDVYDIQDNSNSPMNIVKIGFFNNFLSGF